MDQTYTQAMRKRGEEMKGRETNVGMNPESIFTTTL
jgi:hypothetical protein